MTGHAEVGDQFCSTLFVGRVDVSVEKRHDDNIKLLISQGFHSVAQGCFVELDQDVALGIHALDRFNDRLARDQRFGTTLMLVID